MFKSVCIWHIKNNHTVIGLMKESSEKPDGYWDIFIYAWWDCYFTVS